MSSKLIELVDIPTLERLVLLDRRSRPGRFVVPDAAQVRDGLAVAIVREVGLDEQQAERIAGVVTEWLNVGDSPEAEEVVAALNETPVGGDTDIVRAAMARGAEFKAEVWSGKDMLSVDEFARRLRLSRQTVYNQVDNNLLIGLKHPTKDVLRLPEWQLTKGLAGDPLAEILKALGETGGWAQWYFFDTPDPSLNDASPVDYLSAGVGRDRLARVIEAARRYRDDA